MKRLFGPDDEVIGHIFDQQVHLVASLAFEEEAFHFGKAFRPAERFEAFARDGRIVGVVLRGGLREVEFHGL